MVKELNIRLPPSIQLGHECRKKHIEAIDDYNIEAIEK